MGIPTSSGLRVSVLDQSPVSEGSTGSQALQNTIDLARVADGLGYHRYWVAEHLSILAGLFPGRIDLGIGRAAGTDPMTTFALQRDRRQAAPDDFPEQLAELLALLEDRMPPDHPFHRLAELPGLPETPVPWLLGSSMQSAIWAAELGLPYAFADFINPRGASHAELYRTTFEPSHRIDTPKLAVAAWAIAADTQEEAERLATSARMTFTLPRRGRLIR